MATEQQVDCPLTLEALSDAHSIPSRFDVNQDVSNSVNIMLLTDVNKQHTTL